MSIAEVIVVAESEALANAGGVIGQAPEALLSMADREMSSRGVFPPGTLHSYVENWGCETKIVDRLTDSEADALCEELAAGRRWYDFHGSTDLAKYHIVVITDLPASRSTKTLSQDSAAAARAPSPAESVELDSFPEAARKWWSVGRGRRGRKDPVPLEMYDKYNECDTVDRWVENVLREPWSAWGVKRCGSATRAVGQLFSEHASQGFPSSDLPSIVDEYLYCICATKGACDHWIDKQALLRAAVSLKRGEVEDLDDYARRVACGACPECGRSSLMLLWAGQKGPWLKVTAAVAVVVLLLLIYLNK